MKKKIICQILLLLCIYCIKDIVIDRKYYFFRILQFIYYIRVKRLLKYLNFKVNKLIKRFKNLQYFFYFVKNFKKISECA